MPTETIETKSIRAYLYLWLPSDKDIFGFQNFDNAPLNVKERNQRDQPIFERIVEFFDHRGNSEIKNTAFSGDYSNMRHLELGLRKFQIQFSFDVSKSGAGNDVPLVRGLDTANGSFLVYSNGLYVWQLDLNISKTIYEKFKDNITAQIKTLLSDYLLKMVWEVFDGNLSKVPSDAIVEGEVTDISNYRGILVDTQLNLLINTLLDEEVIAERHFKADKNNEIEIGKLKLGNLLKSIFLFTWDVPGEKEIKTRDYLPIGKVQRKSYSYRDDWAGSKQDKSKKTINPLVTPVDLASPLNEIDKELFVSRLAYSAMEQFIRVTNTFALNHYENGIQYCLQRLSDRVEVQVKQQSPEVSSQSMKNSKTTITYLQSYYLKLKTKNPRLKKIHYLMVGLLDLNVPFSINKDSIYEHIGIDEGLSEWAYSRHSLEQALGQQKEKVVVINDSLGDIHYALTVLRDEIRNYELKEQTKYDEIAVDRINYGNPIVPNSIVKFDLEAESFVGILAALVAIVSILVDIAIEVYGQFLGTSVQNGWDEFKFIYPLAETYELLIFLSVYLSIAVIIIGAFRYLSHKDYLNKIVRWFKPKDEGNALIKARDEEKQKNMRVLEQRYENSKIGLDMLYNNHEDLYREIIRMSSAMPSIIRPQENLVKSNFFVDFEALSSAGKYKYDFHTEPELNQEVYYSFHIEIDEDVIGREMIVSNVRITINYKRSQIRNYRENANLATLQLLKHLVSPSEIGGDIF